jgi:hypothetical protein
MKKKLSFIGILIIVLIIIIQFIKPSPNASPVIIANNISSKYFIPEEVHAILKNSCYDCHSNTTDYPWYSRVQPLAWYLDNHIVDGKKHLNFDEFVNYPLHTQYKKFNKIKELVHDGEMPLYSYTLLHWKAALDSAQKTTIIDWATNGINQLEALYPFDSLHLKKSF